jgi:hypothetical protein
MLTLAASLTIALTVVAEPRPSRVPLFTAGPTRDYQFCQRFFLNEQEKKRAELTICFQGVHAAARQDVPAERLLADFPDRLADRFDLIIAFDPNWSRLAAAQRQELAQWVKDGGGLILIAGRLFTSQLADANLGTIHDLYPVEIDVTKASTTTLVWRLHFHDQERPSFLKLDAGKEGPLAGWDDFFGETGKPPPPEPDMKKVDQLVVQLDDKDFEVRQRAQEELKKLGRAAVLVLEKRLQDRPPLEVRMRAEEVLVELRRHLERRGGFYDCFPVRQVKPTATVLATFANPDLRLPNGAHCPFIVTMPYGKGKVLYVGSGELWRLRQYREAFHERWWSEAAKSLATNPER